MMESKFFTIRQVQDLLAKDGKKPCYETARRLVQGLNKELRSMGYFTFRGLVPRRYVKERMGL